ncbi:thiol-disulfide oxidoreductase DCC family protein [Nissabacter sp. SGAir0207]|uniref:thiol-disulfide oxidoreductase DCC family protein n=1 Tax=Nissabacter sp. SGAir0207 TaxID=2126321 RepID=UPI0010CD43F3|nr:DCC1-like thiol-disulfide oxidoreductase family protein [Nissabacter sp. SGAir0207]QCR36957.1 thiol-disulfide oxidoreductase [Nissabacter sp. SGAir0207]
MSQILSFPRRAAPHLAAGQQVVLFDGECPLCHRLVRVLLHADRQRTLHLATVQSDAGQDLLRWAGLPTDNFNTIAWIHGTDLQVRSDAFFAILAQLGWPWRALGALRLCPRGLRDAVYNGVAKNRYRWFGKLPAGSALPGEGEPGRYLPEGRRAAS